MRSSLGANSYPRNLGGGTEDTSRDVTGIPPQGFPRHLSGDNKTCGIRRLEIACLRKQSRFDLPLVERPIKVGAEARFPPLWALPSPHT